MNTEFFTFANEREWGTPRLEERYAVLEKNDPKHLNTERRGAVVREMCHIAFEGLQRKREANQRAAELNSFNEIVGAE